MCETGEDEVGPSLQLAQKNYAEMKARVEREKRNELQLDKLRAESTTQDIHAVRLTVLEQRFEQFRDEVKGGRW